MLGRIPTGMGEARGLGMRTTQQDGIGKGERERIEPRNGSFGSPSLMGDD